MRVCLVGPGLCTESTHAFADIPIAVVAFVEYGNNFDYAKRCFPNAQGFYDIRVVNKDLENKTLSFPAYDLLVYTAPCYRNTPLRSENGLPVPASAVVFVEEQRKFVKLTRSFYSGVRGFGRGFRLFCGVWRCEVLATLPYGVCREAMVAGLAGLSGSGRVRRS